MIITFCVTGIDNNWHFVILPLDFIEDYLFYQHGIFGAIPATTILSSERKGNEMKPSEKKEIERIMRILWVNIPADELQSRFGIDENEIISALGMLNK